jgi:predicted AlkP superfamily phosphohydrolase/phosphomutase
VRAYVKDMIRGAEQQSQAFIHLLRSTDWRFSFVSLAECHQAGHWLWHLTDPEHPEYDGGLSPELRDGLMRIYEATDKALGAVVAALPAETVTLVISPYSMGPNHHLDEVFPLLLERGGWLVRPEPDQMSPRVRLLRAGRRAVRALVPPRLRPALGRALGRDRLLAELQVGGVDWGSTSTLPVWSDGSAAARLNLAGRDPAGMLAKGPDAERVLSELTETLLELRCADTGHRLVSRVARFEELFDAAPYSGPAELFVQWKRVQRPRAVFAERTGEIPVPAKRSIRSVHYTPGMVVGVGPGIPPSGEALLSPHSEAKLADLGATVLALLGVPAPPEITGRPMPALVPAVAARDS